MWAELYWSAVQNQIYIHQLSKYYICMQNNNRIHSVWIPREENRLADHYSRPNDTNDFGIDFKTFYFIQRKLGICTIDRFADDKNTKIY